MLNRERSGIVVLKKLVGKDSYLIRINPGIPLDYRSGQFLSLKINASDEAPQDVWRPYSFMNPPEIARQECIELFIKPHPGGRALPFLKNLKEGDRIYFRAPYGEFTYQAGTGRSAVFISTGTGIAPLLSIARSTEFLRENRQFSLGIFGFRQAEDVPDLSELSLNPIEVRLAISQGQAVHPQYPAFAGRATDYLRSIGPGFPWTECDYYLCGNQGMISEVNFFLGQKQVNMQTVHYETFESARDVVIRKVA